LVLESSPKSYNDWKSANGRTLPIRGPRHEVVARLGKLDGVEQKKTACGRHHLYALFEGRPIARQLEFCEHAAAPAVAILPAQKRPPHTPRHAVIHPPFTIPYNLTPRFRHR
jgi:hypothetical protein